MNIGSQAPLFKLLDQNGNIFDFANILGKKSAVIFFYPKDDSLVCTKEACSFRDSYQSFIDSNVEVIGISSDSITSHQKFAQKNRLQFTLLSDSDKKVRKLFNVPNNLFGLIPGRVTYIIDSQGIIRHIFNAQTESERHVNEALTILKNL